MGGKKKPPLASLAAAALIPEKGRAQGRLFSRHTKDE
jgi:hypothetical protein